MISIIKFTFNGKNYVTVPEIEKSCEGCAFHYRLDEYPFYHCKLNGVDIVGVGNPADFCYYNDSIYVEDGELK